MDKWTKEDILDKFLCGDFLDITPKIPDNVFNLIICDLPYNLGKQFKNDRHSKNDFINLLELWVKNIIPKLRNDGSLYFFMGYEFQYDLKGILDKYLIFQRELIWHYVHSGNFRHIRNYLSEFDKIFFYTKSKDYTFNEIRKKPSVQVLRRWNECVNEEGVVYYKKLTPYLKRKWKSEEKYLEKGGWNIYKGKPLGNVFYIPAVHTQTKEKMKNPKHPSQKPESLINLFIKVSSNEGDFIGDFFAGTATTLVCAKKLRRNYFGCEIMDNFHIQGEKRLEEISMPKNIKTYLIKKNNLKRFL